MADRILSYGYSVVTMDQEARLDIIDLSAARKAVKKLLKEARAANRELHDPAFSKKWHEHERARAERRLANNTEESKANWEKLAYRQTPEGKAEIAAQTQLKAELPADPVKKTLRIAKALDVTKHFESLYDVIKVGGRAIGDVHYRELDKLREEGLFEAALCDQILRHARPNNNIAVPDVDSEEKLREFERIARLAVQHVQREGIEKIVSGQKWSWRV